MPVSVSTVFLDNIFRGGLKKCLFKRPKHFDVERRQPLLPRHGTAKERGIPKVPLFLVLITT